MLQKYKHTCLRIVKAYKNASFCTAQNKAFEGERETDFLHYLHFSLFGFNIKPEDFHNVSAFRSRGSTLEKGVEPNIVANAAAKVTKFFGLNKKTLQHIATKRHAKRDADKIQQARNARRIANIEESVKNGLLPPQGVPDRVVSVEAGGTQRTYFVLAENCGTTRSPDSAGNSRHQATVGGEAAVRQGESPCRPYLARAWVV